MNHENLTIISKKKKSQIFYEVTKEDTFSLENKTKQSIRID